MSTNPKSTKSPIRVWLVEDNDAFRKTVARGIEQLDGMSCTGSFDNFEAAYRALECEPAPDVVLLDVQLPGIDGISALTHLRERSPNSRAVILTVFDDAEKIFKAVCAGASGYILKTARLEEIGEAIEQVADGGAPMTPKVAKRVLEVFRASGRRPSSVTADDYKLTDREQEILRLMADGLIKKEIADQLDISFHTVSTHMRSIYEKLHVNTNTGAVAKALREDLI